MRRAIRLALASIPMLFVAVGASPVQAQDGFLFQQPHGSLKLRGGMLLPSSNDDLHSFWRNELTLNRNDFNSGTWGGEFAVRITRRVDVALSVDVAKVERVSEFRDWVDEDDDPIEQTTTVRRLPVALSAKYYPLGRGQSISQHAWVPRSVTPYVGAGGGFMHHSITQAGDFVDQETLDIFTDTFEDRGYSELLQVFGGTDVWLTSRFGLSLEAKYMWGDASLEQDFRDYGNVDLRGLTTSIGATVRF